MADDDEPPYSLMHLEKTESPLYRNSLTGRRDGGIFERWRYRQQGGVSGGDGDSVNNLWQPPSRTLLPCIPTIDIFF